MLVIFWTFLIFYEFFLSPQVKRGVIITNKNAIYQLPNDATLVLEKFRNCRKTLTLHEIIAQRQLPPKRKPPAENRAPLSVAYLTAANLARPGILAQC